MKKFSMAIIGILLFVAGYNYTRRQAEYKLANNVATTPVYVTPSTTFPLKAMPVFAFRLNR